MPELPEVQTIVNDLNKKVIGETIQDVWSDWKKMIKLPKSYEEFRRELIGRKIKGARRKSKNILLDLSGDYIILIHQKMTGHLLFGKWKIISGKMAPQTEGELQEKVNNYIHFVLTFKSGNMLALSDLRKFAKIVLGPKKEIENLPELKKLGPELLDNNFTFNKFLWALSGKKGKIKQLLMNQEIISGIGNIYSDEILWEAKIHPISKLEKLKKEQLLKIYLDIKKVLKKSIKLRGNSTSDYRDIYGRRGHYQEIENVYQREDEPCYRCKTKIKRIKIGGRSAHFCPRCQKMY